MPRPRFSSVVVAASVLCAVWHIVASPSFAQVIENAADPFGIAIPYPRIHLAHSRDHRLEGTTAHLRAADPFLLYQLGRDLVVRQFTLKDGAYGAPGAMTVPLYALPGAKPVTHGGIRFARDHSSSCGLCHSAVFREPAGGQTIGSTGGMGRRSTHFFGAGLMEMIAAQVRQLILNQHDRNRNGFIDRQEATGSHPVLIAPVSGGAPIDFGDLSPDSAGVPRLNEVFRIWYVDAEGRVVADADSLADPRAAGFNLVMQVFGWGRGRLERNGRAIALGAEASTAREIYSAAADAHLGLQSFDPTQQRTAAGESAVGAGGAARVSLNGATQYDFAAAADRGTRRNAAGLSVDDPDGDGRISELTEGDLDAVEFYLLHSPAPAVAPPDRGRVLAEIGCTRCHVEKWTLEARDDARGLTGDRRLFRLDASSVVGPDSGPEVTAALHRQSVRDEDGSVAPLGKAFTVEQVYTDFKHWDLGPAFEERRFDGTVQRLHRTAPLWGVGSSPTFGHAGQFLSLDAVIAAHGGHAEAEASRYRSLPEPSRRELIEFLQSLVLYRTDEVPADIDNDGQRVAMFTVSGQPVGYEHFDPRFLFATPPRYTALGTIVGASGLTLPLMLVENINDTYGLGQRYRLDANRDSVPDALPLPDVRGGLLGARVQPVAVVSLAVVIMTSFVVWAARSRQRSRA